MVAAATKEAPTNAVTVREESNISVLANQNRLYDILERALHDKDVDVDKLERIANLARTVRADDAKAAYYAALVQMKADLPVIDRKGRIEIRKKGASGERDGEIQQSTAFARWEDIDEAITPVLKRHGFVLTFRSGQASDGKVAITAVLAHELGHVEETTLPLMHDGSGSKNPVQAIGSSLSYGKRYAATFLLNIRTKGEDDDGGEGGADETIDDVQIQNIIDMLARDGMDKDKFCKTIKVDSIPDIRRRDYPEVITKINEVSLQRARAKASQKVSA